MVRCKANRKAMAGQSCSKNEAKEPSDQQDCCYKMVDDKKLLGRHYVATRRIERGEIVIREDEPLLQGPPLETESICLECGDRLSSGDEGDFRPCDKCGWPLCSQCESHTKPECEFTQKYHKNGRVQTKPVPKMAHPAYRCVTVIRALMLRETEPRVSEKFMRLSGDCRASDKDDHLTVARFVKTFFSKYEESVEEIAKVSAIIQINAHELPICEPAQIAVYDLASYLEHSCQANCSKIFTDQGGLLIRASDTIEPGEHLSICYTDPLWSTQSRQMHLQVTKNFDCGCRRCQDPSEAATYFSGLLCPFCETKDAVMVREKVDDGTDGLGQGQMAEEKLECAKCRDKLDVAKAGLDDLLLEIGQKLHKLEKNSVEACRGFLKEHEPLLHRNHYYMVDVKMALAQLIGQEQGRGLGQISTDLLKEKIQLCDDLSELLLTLAPAEHRARGTILFELSAAYAEYARRESLLMPVLLKESKRSLDAAYELLKYEPDCLPEGKIAMAARKNLEELERVITRFDKMRLNPPTFP
ncbi:uncharacterized protein LOC106654698 [Trichogramma pretiosum]|uniref:uncharacterized protein LOC106654698 n=1 Tax=Trichogramma pretiosum TaxID=7493 RepID=UPI0006C9CFCB|nr:uncharacterized protein LOC106654698 [Trichogramma pretiosum]